MKRIEKKFKELKTKKQAAFIAYICAGDPNYETCFEILKNLPKTGVDIIEIGVPFLDPAGDGPTIEKASKRAISNGFDLKKTFSMVKEFRKINSSTPIVLMGYYNPFLKYGLHKVFLDAQNCGADAVLIVDLPFEERSEIKNYIEATNLDFIDLIAPLTNEERIKKITKQSSGFLYLVSMLGITGTKQAKLSDNIINLKKLQKNSSLPIAIGFGIQEPKQAKEFAKIGFNGVVVGSAIVKEIEQNYLKQKSLSEITKNVLKKVAEFAKEIKS